MPLIRNIEVSLKRITLFIGAFSNSKITMVLHRFNRISFGTYNVICGPAIGQYRPRLKPFTYMNPYLIFKEKICHNFPFKQEVFFIRNTFYLSPSSRIDECIADFINYIE